MQGPGPYPQQPQQPYAQQPMQQQAMQPAQGAWGAPMQAARQPKRNVALIVVGLILIVIAFLAFALFAYNAYQYSTIDEKFADLPDYAREFGVRIVKEASMKRMVIFGVVATLFGLPGLVLSLLGMRKK